MWKGIGKGSRPLLPEVTEEHLLRIVAMVSKGMTPSQPSPAPAPTAPRKPKKTPKGKRCFRCGRAGHMARECRASPYPQPGVDGSKPEIHEHSEAKIGKDPQKETEGTKRT